MKTLKSLFSLLVLAACGSGNGTDITRSGFVTPVGGQIPVNLINEQNGGTVGTFASASYVTGYNASGAVAYAGVEAFGNPGPMPVAQLNYSSLWEIIGIANVSETPTSFDGTNFSDGGSFSLAFDPLNNSLTGFGVGTAGGTLTINGVVSAGNISGSVNYGGVSGSLVGLLGQNGLLGAFHGNNSTTVFAGDMRSQ